MANDNTIFPNDIIFCFVSIYSVLRRFKSIKGNIIMDINNRMTRKEAANYIGVSTATMANWACTGKVKLPYYKAGLKKVIYLKSDLDEYLKSTRREQA